MCARAWAWAWGRACAHACAPPHETLCRCPDRHPMNAQLKSLRTEFKRKQCRQGLGGQAVSVPILSETSSTGYLGSKVRWKRC